MLFFIDESWQQTKSGRFSVGVLAAVAIPEEVFNEFSISAYVLKRKCFGPAADTYEFKGTSLFSRSSFKLERSGINCVNLNLAREILSLCEAKKFTVFASATFATEEIPLECSNEHNLERPFFFLVERLDKYMRENCPGKVGKLIFDDRSYSTNLKISKAISNFFHKSYIGRSFDTILKAPLFCISSQNIGVQISDLVAYIIGRRFTGDKVMIPEFFQKIKAMEFESAETRGVDLWGRQLTLKGIKVIKERIRPDEDDADKGKKDGTGS